MSQDVSPELLDFLDKFVDKQSNANTAVAQKLATIEINCTNMAADSKEIGDESHNGFRSELKTHLDEHIKEVDGKLGAIDKRLEKLTSLSFWLRNIAIVVAGMAAIVAGIIQLIK